MRVLIGPGHYLDTELTDLYARPEAAGEGPWLRVNFVSTLDGSAQGSDGLSGSINNAADKLVFDTVRQLADCLIVGAGTLRAEQYGVPTRPDGSPLPLVVVSRSGDVPETLRDVDPELVIVDDGSDFARLKAQLAERGWCNQLCEGGPSLFTSLLDVGVVDELCLTLVPRLVGGEGLRITRGPEIDRTLTPYLLVEHQHTLLGRWLIS